MNKLNEYDSKMEYCYFLNGSCGDQESVPGKCMGLSVAQMKSQAVFTNWDFENTWVIDKTSSYNYPQLRSCMQIPVTSVEIVSEPEKNIYEKGENLDLSGGRISVYHEADNTTGETDITESMLGEYNMEQIGKQSIPVTYIDKSTEFEITVNPKPVENVRISNETEGTVSISWEKQTGISGYYVYKRSSEDEEWSEGVKVKDASFTEKTENADTAMIYAVSSYLTVDGIDYISEKTIAVNPLDFTKAEIRIDDIIYDYEPHLVAPKVIYNGKILTEGKDYDIVSGDYEVTEPGRYSLTLKGKNSYEGTVTVEFNVSCKYHQLEHDTWGKCTVCGEIPETVDISRAEAGTFMIVPEVSSEEECDNIDIEYFYNAVNDFVTYDGYVLKRDIDYIIPEDKIVRENRFGECTFTVEGIGCFEGDLEVSSTIYCIHGYLYDHKKENNCKYCGARSGDVSGNGKVDLYDAIAIAQTLIGVKYFNIDEYYIADFNRDSKVDLYDAIAIAKYILTNK